MEIYVTQFVLFLLLMVRITSLIIVAPVMGHSAVPVQVKLAFGAFFSFVYYPLAAASAPALDLNVVGLVVIALKEAAVGLLIGFATGLIFAGVQSAGELIGFELGFSLATVFDPENGANNSIMAQFLYLFAAIVFLALNGYHFILQALQLSYQTVPVNGLVLSPAAGEKLIGLGGTVIAIAVKLAAPVIVTGFLVNIAMAVLTRVAPQMNVFIMSFPVKIAVVFILLMTAGPMLIAVFKKLLTGFELDVLELVRAL
jgi:flagellar biosynthesis protein FliR